MKFLVAHFLDTIIQHHSIILLRLVLIWSKILLHIWYQSIMIIFGLRITAEYHNHYLTMYQKAATQYTSDIDWKLSKKERKNLFPCFVHPTPFIVCVCLLALWPASWRLGQEALRDLGLLCSRHSAVPPLVLKELPDAKYSRITPRYIRKCHVRLWMDEYLIRKYPYLETLYPLRFAS